MGLQKRHIFITATLLLVVTLVISTLTGVISPKSALAYPTPAFVPPRDAWQIDLELHGEPMPLWITLPGEDKPKRFWYLLYTITNNTDADIDFYPQFDLFTNTLQLHHAGVGVRRTVYYAILEQYATTFPLLEPENMVTGPILRGGDNARDSVAIFADFDPKATKATVFIAGLCNENVSVKHPTKIDSETGLPKEVLLRKTLMLEYQIAGDGLNPSTQTMLYRDRKWIMR